MKKFKKILLKTFSVFLFVICLVFSSCFSSSALTTVNFVCNRPTVTDHSCYFEVVNQDGQPYIFYVYFEAERMTTYYDTTSRFDISDYYSFYFDVNFVDGNLWVSVYPNSGSYEDTRFWEYFDVEVYGVLVSPDGSSRFIPSPSYDVDTVGIFLGENYHCIRGYNVVVDAHGSDYVFTYSNEININNKLDSIIDILQNGGFTQIGALIGKATQDTDKLLENQEQYQDEILNGWQPDDDVDFDSSLNDDYSDLDKELIDSTADGRAEADEVFDNFDSLLETEDDNPETPSSHNHLTNGLLCVTAIFNEFTKIDWLHNILTFSLALGVFAFVIGTASAVFKSSHEKHEYNKVGKTSSSDDS